MFNIHNSFLCSTLYYCLFYSTIEYRLKCEEESNYLEAGRAHKQLSVLRKQEEKRQQNAVKARQVSEREDVQLAHNMQFNEFNSAWNTYIEGMKLGDMMSCQFA